MHCKKMRDSRLHAYRGIMTRQWVIALAILVASGAARAATVYDCKLTTSATGYVTERYIFDYDASAGTVLVFDALIKQAMGKPISGVVSVDTPAQTAFVWNVPYTNRSGQSAKFSFRGTYLKASKQIIVVGQVGGGEYRG